MQVDVGPFARLLRALSTPKLFAVGATLVGMVAFCYFEVPVRVLRPVGPLVALALGIGVAALLIGTARLFALGGRAGIAVGIALAMALVLAGASLWYALEVVQPHARGACYTALRPASFDDPIADRARCRALVGSALFRFAERLRPDPSIIEDCYHDEADAVRTSHGLCPRELRGNEQCQCGSSRFPRTSPCVHPRCVLDHSNAILECH